MCTYYVVIRHIIIIVLHLSTKRIVAVLCGLVVYNKLLVPSSLMAARCRQTWDEVTVCYAGYPCLDDIVNQY